MVSCSTGLINLDPSAPNGQKGQVMVEIPGEKPDTVNGWVDYDKYIIQVKR